MKKGAGDKDVDDFSSRGRPGGGPGAMSSWKATGPSRKLSIRQRRMRQPGFKAPPRGQDKGQTNPNGWARIRPRVNSHAKNYQKYKINNFAKGSPKWQKAMIQYLLAMKSSGHHIKTVSTNKVSDVFLKNDK